MSRPVLIAKANVWELSGELTCVLRAGADFDRMIAWESGMIVGTVVHRFKKPSRAWLHRGGQDHHQGGLNGRLRATLSVGL
jgi:hypothetical protein